MEYFYKWTSETLQGKTVILTKKVGLVDNKPRYIEFKANTVVSWLDNSAIKEPEYDKFEAFVVQKRGEAPEGLKFIDQVAPLAWAWMPSEKAFVRSALQGMGISIAFAFVILIFATQNIFLAILSILCVIIVILSVVTIMVL